MEQRAQEVRSLMAEAEQLKRREVSWSLELQDAASVTSQLTERMELLEAALSIKEESFQASEVWPRPSPLNCRIKLLGVAVNKMLQPDLSAPTTCVILRTAPRRGGLNNNLSDHRLRLCDDLAHNGCASPAGNGICPCVG